MIIHAFDLESKLDETHVRFLCSDLHIGSRCFDEAKFIKQAESAKKHGARILINGDVFDCIGAKDKRFDLACLHPRFASQKDLTSSIVSYAADLLHPFRKNIDVIGIGNHEETWINHCGTDPVRLLINQLNAGGAHIYHGGFSGFIKTTFTIPGTKRRPTHCLFYLHGAGGDSPIAKGSTNFFRRARNWTYDAVTFGHAHNIMATVDVVSSVTAGNKYRERKQIGLETGSYYRNYTQVDEQNVLNYSYAASKIHPPKPAGGLFLYLTPTTDENGEIIVDQAFATDIVVLRKFS